MEPNSFGKKLGIGLRVAGNVARQRAAEAARSAGEAPPRTAASQAPVVTARHTSGGRTVPASKDRGRNIGQGLGRGAKNFGQSFFAPFAHASNVLWLEITGCFFALFALFFGQNVFLLRAQYAAGALHQKFVLYAVLTAVFVYFSGSSFLKARQKARKQRKGR